MSDKLSTENVPSLGRPPHLGGHYAPLDKDNDTVASFTQGDLRRFVANLLSSDPGVLPQPKTDPTKELPTTQLDGDVPVWDRASQRWVPSSAKKQTVEGWTTATLLGTWNNRAGEPTAAYYKDPFDRVWLRGTVQNGAVPSTIFQLPAGYRPPDNYRRYIVIATASADQSGYIYIDSSGNVVFNFGATTAEVDLNQISFRVT